MEGDCVSVQEICNQVLIGSHYNGLIHQNKRNCSLIRNLSTFPFFQFTPKKDCTHANVLLFLLVLFISVKPALFDLFLAVGITLYLGVVYLTIEVSFTVTFKLYLNILISAVEPLQSIIYQNSVYRVS